MIAGHRTSWLRSVFALRGTALKRIWLRLSLAAIISVAITLAQLRFQTFTDFHFTIAPFSLIGLALSIFLGFRNNTSYDRFWEGRKLWGRLVNTSRSLARQVLTLIAYDGERESNDRELVYRIIAYVHSLRLHLRDIGDNQQLDGLLPPDEIDALSDQNNRPYAISQGLAVRFRALYDSGAVHAMHLMALEQSLTDLTDIQGGCERIKSTPIPYSYNVLIHRIVAVYCFTLPFGLVTSIGAFTPVVVLLVAYAFFGLDNVGEQIEDPFGFDPNDLPLDVICATIETNLRQRLGQTELPVIPSGDVLT